MSENLKSEIIYDIDYKEWNNDLLKNIASTVYQTSNWQEIYKRTYDLETIFIRISKPNDKLISQLSGIIHKKLFLD